jgi:hypothetical protein
MATSQTSLHKARRLTARARQATDGSPRKTGPGTATAGAALTCDAGQGRE